VRRLASLVRTTSFRLTLLYAGLFVVSAAVLFAVIYWATAGYMQGEFDAVVETELATLRGRYEDAGPAALAATVRERIKMPSNRSAFYRLQDGTGAPLAGNLPAPVPAAAGWRDLMLPGDAVGDDEPHRVRGKGAPLPDGSYLFVAQDYFPLDELRELVVRAFGWSAAATLALALGGGAIMSGSLLRRIEAMNETSERIMAGELHRRVPVRGTGDEFDRLAANLNTMLDRTEHLMAGLRQVSNDIAHDLRTPLTRLRQNLEAARRRTPGNLAAYEAAMDRAIDETDAILDTFGALLRIAQVEAGTRRAGFDAVDLSSVLEAVIEVYAPAADDKQQALDTRVPPGVVVIGDRELLTRMLANIVENAIRHSPPGGRIEASLEATRGVAEIVVADSGPGIPEEERGKVFRRFYRLEASRSTPGSGLGLSLVAAVAELHGIAIRLSDHAPGLRVSLEFPNARGAESV
jgi:signal transduction histidine kinase